MASPYLTPASAPESPSQYSQNSSTRPSSRRSTLRHSFLGLFAHTLSETIPEDHEADNVRITRIDETPPRLGSLDFPREEISLQSPRSVTSVRSMIDPAANPKTSSRPTSGASSRPRSGTSARNPSIRSISRTPSVSSSLRNEILPIQAPARVLDYGGHAHANPASEVAEQLPTRHPADILLHERHPADTPLHGRHPADPLPNGSVSEASEASGASGRSRWRKRRKAKRGRQGMPRHRFGTKVFPALRHASVRRKVFHCLVTGSLMLLVFIVFLALMSSTNDFAQEFRIITILFMLIFVVLFAHSMIRLMVLLVRLRRNGGLADPDDDDPESYAQVTEPIQVVLQRDEELGLSGNEPAEGNKEVTPLPPAYGRWRGSVRVDPNLIHWERNASNERPLSEGTLRRPPSYISERDEELEAAEANADSLSEKPIRPRTPPVEPPQQQRAQRATIIYDAHQSWVPQMQQMQQMHQQQPMQQRPHNG